MGQKGQDTRLVFQIKTKKIERAINCFKSIVDTKLSQETVDCTNFEYFW